MAGLRARRRRRSSAAAVRKRDANTLWVAKQLARLGKIHPRDVGFAGLKDRDAVAEQAFTVPVRSAIGLDWVGQGAEGFEVVARDAPARKLKRGALRGNDFELVLRDFTGDRDAGEQRLRALSQARRAELFRPAALRPRADTICDVARRWLSRRRRLSGARAARLRAVGRARGHLQRRARAARRDRHLERAARRRRRESRRQRQHLRSAGRSTTTLSERCRCSTFIRPDRCGAGARRSGPGERRCTSGSRRAVRSVRGRAGASRARSRSAARCACRCTQLELGVAAVVTCAAVPPGRGLLRDRGAARADRQRVLAAGTPESDE